MLASPAPAAPSAGSGAGGTGEDAAARVRDELEQLKARFAQAEEKQREGLLLEAEDLLIHVCGQGRYDSLVTELKEIGADDAALEEEKRELYRSGQASNRLARWKSESPLLKDIRLRREKVADRRENLKRRVAGIAYRQ